MQVLVVDDDVVSRMVMMHLVDSCGAYEVVEAEDGEDAWNQLRAGLRPGICFCDLRMPNLSGMELLARVKADPELEAMRFVLASSAGDHATMAEANVLGAGGYIIKPFERDQVVAQLAGLAPHAAGLVEEAEDPRVTMERLGIDGARLLVYLGGFNTQLTEAGPALAALLEGDGQGEARARIERLHAGCVTLGLGGAAVRLDALGLGLLDEARIDRALTATRSAVREQGERVRKMAPQRGD
jgi:two-component system chemotaxis response regulator CheY